MRVISDFRSPRPSPEQKLRVYTTIFVGSLMIDVATPQCRDTCEFILTYTFDNIIFRSSKLTSL
jgi:hypothetical protein